MNVKPITWTIAYRKPRANRFQRVTNWHGTWNDAYAVAREFANANPELQVFYVVTLATEQDGNNPEDAGNVLVDSGKRVRIIDNGALTGDVLAYAVSLLMDAANEENAMIDEAYIGKAKDAGITIPAYLACRKLHARKGEIKSGGFWNCCEANPTHVVTFDVGVRQAVCKGCASAYTGEVAEIPADLVTTYRCECGDSYFATQDTMPVTDSDSEEIVSDEEKAFAQVVIDSAELSIAALTPALESAKRTFESARDNNASEATVSITYQAYCDVFRSIEEHKRTIAYATDMLS